MAAVWEVDTIRRFSVVFGMIGQEADEYVARTLGDGLIRGCQNNLWEGFAETELTSGHYPAIRRNHALN